MGKALVMCKGCAKPGKQVMGKRGAEEVRGGLAILKDSDLAKAAKIYKAKTGVGCDPLDLTRETRGEVVEFFEKVEQCFG